MVRMPGRQLLTAEARLGSALLLPLYKWGD